LTEKNLLRVGTNVQDITKKLDSIDDKLTKLSARIAGIEKALGIEQVSVPIKQEPQPEPLEKKPSSSAKSFYKIEPSVIDE
jgi:hypothetical protein